VSNTSEWQNVKLFNEAASARAELTPAFSGPPADPDKVL
jgi:hypothetical protein